MIQQTFYDQTEKAKQEGIELVFHNANTSWKKLAAKKLMEVANTKKLFTSDDILMPLEAEGIVTKDNRAIAAILQAASRMNLIKATGIFLTCKRRSRHYAPIRQWESLIFKG